MTISNSLRDVIEDPDFTDPVEIRHDQSADVDDDGNVEFVLSDPVQEELLVCEPESTPFEIGPTGQNDDTVFAACAMADHPLGDDDRVTYNPGYGSADYRAVELKPTSFDGDQFGWFKLVEDNRGEPVSEDDDDTGQHPGVR